MPRKNILQQDQKKKKKNLDQRKLRDHETDRPALKEIPKGIVQAGETTVSGGRLATQEGIKSNGNGNY